MKSLENTTSIERSDEWNRSFPMIVYRRGLSEDLIVEKGGVEFFDLADHIVDRMISKVT